MTTLAKTKPKSVKEAPPKTSSNIFGVNKIQEPVEDSKNHELIELLLNLSEQIFSQENIEIKTVLEPKQVLPFSRAKLYGEIFEVPVVQNMVKIVSIYNISKGGRSRKEFGELAKSILSYTSEQEKQKSLPKHLLGIE